MKIRVIIQKLEDNSNYPGLPREIQRELWREYDTAVVDGSAVNVTDWNKEIPELVEQLVQDGNKLPF